jgi:hypothetical protein
MARIGWNPLDALRRQRRRLAAALVPAVLVAVLSGVACPAMSTAPPAAAPVAHHEHPAHAHHAADHERAPAQPTGDCPHCPGGHEAANVAATHCAVAAAPVVTHDALAAASIPALPAKHRIVPGATALPPSIRGSPRAAPLPASTVPLHLRHCVLQI